MTDPDLDQVVIIALGANLPGGHADVRAQLETATAQIAARGFVIRARSSWWRSQAWPDPTDPPFLNGVLLVETGLEPVNLLDHLRAIEDIFGRRRGAANAPRTLDLDLIAYGRRVLEGPELVLPHPRAHERAFVMGPLSEVAPHWRHPLLGATARDLAAHAAVGADARPEEP